MKPDQSSGSFLSAIMIAAFSIIMGFVIIFFALSFALSGRVE